MPLQPDEIIAHAASLTEADLAAILLAKCPSHINGQKLEVVSLNARADGDVYFDLHAAGECVASEPSIESGVKRLTQKIESPKMRADSLRMSAAGLLAMANKLDPQ